MLDRPQKALLRALACVPLLWALPACNPFAPHLDNEIANPEKVLGDRKKIDGFFDWFRNSYQLRDTTMYGKILAPDFVFTYLNFENSTEESWERNVEINSAHNMFRNVKSINLQWNHYIELDTITYDTLARVERSFNLIITQDDNNIYRGVGSALLVLRRNNPNDFWRMKSWYDKSDF